MNWMVDCLSFKLNLFRWKLLLFIISYFIVWLLNKATFRFILLLDDASWVCEYLKNKLFHYLQFYLKWRYLLFDSIRKLIFFPPFLPLFWCTYLCKKLLFLILHCHLKLSSRHNFLFQARRSTSLTNSYLEINLFLTTVYPKWSFAHFVSYSYFKICKQRPILLSVLFIQVIKINRCDSLVHFIPNKIMYPSVEGIKGLRLSTTVTWTGWRCREGERGWESRGEGQSWLRSVWRE